MSDGSPEHGAAGPEGGAPLPGGGGGSGGASGGGAREQIDSIKLTLISLVIAFAMTLVFRGFLLEGFIIPTGSMAPTLLGEHWRVRSPASGHDWAINSRFGPVEDAQGRTLSASDPVTRAPLALRNPERSAGDRILVMKWPYAMRDPDRWDVVVFKNPELPRENYIKRLVGLPGEDVWLVDGDVFVRKASGQRGNEGSREGGEWRIARKPERVQRALWRPVWSSECAWAEGLLRGDAPSPADEVDTGEREALVGSEDVEGEGETTRGELALAGPWSGDGWEWINGGRGLRHSGAGASRLTWDAARWPIVDWNPYNEPQAPNWRDARRYYPVGDVRVRFVVDNPEFSVRVRAEGRDWVVRVRVGSSGDEAFLEDAPAETGVAARAPLAIQGWRVDESPLRSAPVMFEVCVVDQAVELYVDGSRALRHEYNMTPRERLMRATGRSSEEIAALLGEQGAEVRGNPLADPALYSPPEISIEFEGGPVTLERLGVDRDIYYRPGVMEADPRTPARATHPLSLARLSPSEFFVLGDNSGASKDGRLWDSVDPWVAREIDPEPGVVPRALLLGKAFFVYFPAAHEVRVAGRDRPLVPDFGRMRWIK